mmetsp:Transcript_18060/g.34745  ORF Transcript_18060/g.34745 Transcript_18060/m.34745 type:complete len:484 (-) Transcript_18060:302-1753(-)|eukprot:CAMPEP_0172736794 /NCGR_PEP_ID=MMETSP1074-20121228/115969_1 /TAXON_ID=2916 /ORGANISM="Ceratium fusus, Strain PA161109" /LENGTH=483 /DNA_ID=CAMNT_0013566067 /DNA_START=59 /DNA_END=1510 /DNA_ORIENTATION=+
MSKTGAVSTHDQGDNGVTPSKDEDASTQMELSSYGFPALTPQYPCSYPGAWLTPGHANAASLHASNAGMMHHAHQGYWLLPHMGMPPILPACYAPNGQHSSGKGWDWWDRDGSHRGGKGGAGRGQRGSPGFGNSSGKGRHHQQEVASQSTLSMTAEWREGWKKRLEGHKIDTPEHTQYVEKLLEELQGNVWDASKHKEGCHVVQLVMLHCKTKDLPRICSELHEKVWEAVEHPYANFVLQALITAAPGASCRFIIEECKPKAGELAKHRYGCRILCRIAEHCLGDEQAMILIGHVLSDPQAVANLCCHNFGHHVVQQIMEKGRTNHREIIVNALLFPDLIKMAQNRHASYIIEAAFDYCDEREKGMLKTELLKGRNIIDLAKHQFGGFVVKKLAGQEGEEDEEEQDEDCDEEAEAFEKKMQREVQQTLLKHEAELMKDKNGTKVWNEIFPSRRGQDLSGQEAEDKGPPYSAQGDEGQEICKHK